MKMDIIKDFIDKHLYADAASTLEAASIEPVGHLDVLKLHSCASFFLRCSALIHVQYHSKWSCLFEL